MKNEESKNKQNEREINHENGGQKETRGKPFIKTHQTKIFKRQKE